MVRKRKLTGTLHYHMKECENFSGADLAALKNEAGMAALIEKWNSTDENIETIKTCHFEVAFTKVSPSVSKKQREYYKNNTKSSKAVSESGAAI